jgi:hypothetical protein
MNFPHLSHVILRYIYIYCGTEVFFEGIGCFFELYILFIEIKYILFIGMVLRFLFLRHRLFFQGIYPVYWNCTEVSQPVQRSNIYTIPQRTNSNKRSTRVAYARMILETLEVAYLSDYIYINIYIRANDTRDS